MWSLIKFILLLWLCGWIAHATGSTVLTVIAFIIGAITLAPPASGKLSQPKSCPSLLGVVLAVIGVSWLLGGGGDE
ncbi:MAG: hypothetical protein OEW58_12300 [Gammaproteobacteria bacterium]|nr:hypothetical protein [Gammaproteobacteria bacterium]